MGKINLKEILHPQMDILFVALNPPVNSNNNGHYFSNNLSFWNLLLNSGLITTAVRNKLTGEEEVFRRNSITYKNAIYGITDLVHDVVETNSNKVKVNKSRVERILEILNTHEVKIVCLMHSSVSNAFQDAGLVNRNTDYGLVGEYKGTAIYEVPFHNASIENKEKYYKLLKTSIIN
jgi:G:T/U-mismatch repair DNA glycosylase